jgi:hypothetical protein
MSTETQSYNKPSYGLSSWNYGSFHASNPCYAPPRHTRCQTESEDIRCQSAKFNKHGKRKLAQDERIVTEEYMKVMKDSKTIKNSNTQKRLNTSVGRSNTEINTSINRRDSLNSSDVLKKKNLRYQLSFEEWAIMKNKQEEIFKRVQVIKESEDKKFELFNKKIDQNYEKVK